MFVRQKNYDDAIQKVRIEVGTLVGLENDNEAFVTLCEMPMLLQMKMKSKARDGEMPLMEFFQEMLPSIIVDHNFYETETQKMSNEALASLIFEKRDLATKVITAYSDASFFSQARQTESR